MKKHIEFINIIRSDSFWEGDEFIIASEVLLDFEESDWNKLETIWKDLSDEEKSQVIISLDFNGTHFQYFIAFTKFLIETGEITNGYQFFSCILMNTFTQFEEDKYHQIAFSLFKHIKERKWKEHLKHCLWRNVQTNKFLRKFQFDSWEAVYNL